MTEVYFVRHCQSKTNWKNSDKTRPLTERGMKDSVMVTLALSDIHFDYCVCSSYTRSIDTIKDCANNHKLEIHTDPRFTERISGRDSNIETIYKRWDDHDYHEDGGESINEVQKRNIEGLFELLEKHNNEKILFGTHGTALCTILNYYDKNFGVKDFIELWDWMPYIIHASFDGTRLVAKENLLIVNRGY